MSTQPRVAIYARVSTHDQTPDAQLHDLREYLRNRGWSDVQEFTDVGESGAKDSRPAWNQAWELVRKHKINVLVVHALDRLGRSLPHLVKIISTLSENNITLISYRENLDLSTAQGRMLAGLFSVLANYELELIRERTRAGMRAAKARGSQIGRRKKYFDVKKAEQLRDQGMGIIKIAKELGGIGVQRVQQWVKHEYLPPDKRRELEDAVNTMEDGE
jgi:DNA invertase Pin-like site-specific DNA recombinase